MKILLFNTLYYPNMIGGAEKSVQALAEKLAAKNYSVSVVSTSTKAYIDIINNVKVYYIQTKNIYWGFDKRNKSNAEKLLWHAIDTYNIQLKNKIQEIINTENPEVIHTNNLSGFSAIVWKIANRNNIKIVHTLRDYYLLCPKTTMFKNNTNCVTPCRNCKIYSIPKKKLSNKVDAVVGISNFILSKHEDLNYFENAEIKQVVGNDVGKIKEGRNEKTNETITFGFIGQVTKNKGIELLLETFMQISPSYNWKLLIAGNGKKEYLNFLTKKYQNNKIQFLGRVDAQDFYIKINVLIVPSLWEEPFGRVVLEGVKYGKYVIGSNRGGIKELLDPESLFEPENKNALYSKIIDILKSNIIPMNKKPLEKDSTEEYISIYNALTLK